MCAKAVRVKIVTSQLPDAVLNSIQQQDKWEDSNDTGQNDR